MRINWIMSGRAPTYKRFGHIWALMITAAGMAMTSALALSVPANAKPAPGAATTDPGNLFKIDGQLTSAYGKAKDPFNDGAYRNHHGVDFKAPKGTPIYAPAEGIVIESANVFERSPAYGTVVIIQTAGGVQTMLAHLDSFDVKTGERFAKGAKLAEIGSSGKSTGPHVHIETRLNGKRVDPMSVWSFD